MASFVGRNSELKTLGEVFKSNIRNCYIEAVPRSGATALIRRFCEKHRYLYVTFPESTGAECHQSDADPLDVAVAEHGEDRTLDGGHPLPDTEGTACVHQE